MSTSVFKLVLLYVGLNNHYVMCKLEIFFSAQKFQIKRYNLILSISYHTALSSA